MNNLAKNNTELYNRYKELAPKLLDQISRLLIAFRSSGIIMPRGIKNIFEFTWEELIMEPTSLSPSKISGLDVCFGQYSSSIDSSMSPSLSRRPMFKGSSLPSSYIQPMPNSHQILHKFQSKSLHLLSELLSLKMKMMIESATCPSPVALSKQVAETNHLLQLKAKEMILQSMLDTVGLGKGGNQINVFTAIGVNSPYQLIYQASNACLSFSLSGAKERRRATLSKQKLFGTDDSTGRITGSSSSDPLFLIDPCPQAREKLQEMCRIIEAEKRTLKGKRFSFPVILRDYNEKSSSFQAVTSSSYPSHTANKQVQTVETKIKKASKFHYTFYDGTTFVFYPSGHIAVCQIPTCCKGRYTTCIFDDMPNFPVLSLFTADGHGNVQYNLKNRCTCLFMMDREGGFIRDTTGNTVHKWNWTSKKRTLLSLEYMVNEHIKLKLFGKDSILIVFSAKNESVTLVLSPTDCPHGIPHGKRYSFRRSAEEKTSKMIRALVEIKKRFQKTVTQFMNSVLLAAGLLTIDYPVKDEIDLSRFKKKTISYLEWVEKAPSELHSRAHSTLPASSMGDISQDDSSSVTINTFKKKSVKVPVKISSRPKSAATSENRGSHTWAVSPGDCPLILRKLILKEDTGLGCKCLVKSPALTDLEFERFISAPRDPSQVLVICVITSQNPNNASHLEWTVNMLYLHNQHGRPSPCIQCRHDPYRLLRYDIHGALQKDPPLLVQKYAVIPGMILMFAGGKLLFGGSIFNGYECCSKKNLLKQIFQARRDSKMGYFLPEDFKFSTLSPFPQHVEAPPTEEKIVKDQEEDLVEELQEMKPNPIIYVTSETDIEDQNTENTKIKESDSLSSVSKPVMDTLSELSPLHLKTRKKSLGSRKKGSKLKK